MDILCLKLKKDLSLKLKEYSQMMDYTSCVNYDEQYITDIVENHVSPVVFQFNVKQEYDKTKCQARLWAREGKDYNVIILNVQIVIIAINIIV